jgi:hypothetical protein
MGLGNYLNKQHSCNLLSRRSFILQVPSGWCPDARRRAMWPSPFPSRENSARMRTGTRGSGEGERIVRKFERHALTQAYTVPILW